MKWSQCFIPTLREDPADAEVPSHKLMVRAGCINKLSSGFYSYLPLGFRVLEKVTAIVREEMRRAGAQEVLLPAVHPAELWQKTGRYDVLKEIFFESSDRQGAELIFAPTHEEVITSLVAHFIKSYRDLPQILYQIQTKFRDEPRPRSGVIRSREFIMKDAYSFDRDKDGLNASYQKMYDAYCAIFSRCGLNYVIAEADSGAMGGDVSHEFMAPSDVGEDQIVRCTACSWASNLEHAECARTMCAPSGAENAPAVEEVATPGKTTVDEVSVFLKVSPRSMLKTLIYEIDGKPHAVIVRGDHAVNEVKLARFFKTANVALADAASIERVSGAPVGFAGPVKMARKVPLVVDESVCDGAVYAAGGNKKDTHVRSVVPGRDFTPDIKADVRFVTEDDECPHCKGEVEFIRSIEIGHVFKLGTKYSLPLEANFADESGAVCESIMGCYGIGVNRIIASAIEQNYDDNGIIWPRSIAPYEVIVLPLNTDSEDIMSHAGRIHDALADKGYDVLIDDRPLRAGAKFKDADLIGIPLAVIVGEKGIKDGKVEVKVRCTGEKVFVEVDKVIAKIQEMLG